MHDLGDDVRDLARNQSRATGLVYNILAMITIAAFLLAACILLRLLSWVLFFGFL